MSREVGFAPQREKINEAVRPKPHQKRGGRLGGGEGGGMHGREFKGKKTTGGTDWQLAEKA
jgi:hypothetical protein